MDNIYSSLMDPRGGSDRGGISDDMGILAMDIGLGLFGRTLMTGKTGRGGLYKQYRKHMHKAYPLKPESYLMFAGQQARAENTAAIMKRKSGYKSFSKLGRSFRGIGLAAAGLGLLDFGLNIGMMLSQPSVNRQALDRDKEMFYDEMMTDSRMAYTQRQRAIQAMHDSQLSVGRSLIGQEARYLHK